MKFWLFLACLGGAYASLPMVESTGLRGGLSWLVGSAYFLLCLGVFRLVENVRHRRLERQVERLLVTIGEMPSGPCPECVDGKLTVRYLSPAERDPLVYFRPFRFTCGACDFETKSASPVFYMDDVDSAGRRSITASIGR